MAETGNGPIYYKSNLAYLISVDPASPDPQPTQIGPYRELFDTFDVSPDRKTVVYDGLRLLPDNPKDNCSRSSDEPYDDFSLGVPTEVDIKTFGIATLAPPIPTSTVAASR